MVKSLFKHREESAICLDLSSGLYHAVCLREILCLELALLERWERPLSFILLRLPKPGKGRGDHLKGLAKLLSPCLRAIDLAGRLSADEVAIVMPDAGLEQAGGRLKELWPALCGLFDDIQVGLVQAGPFEGWTPASLLARAEADLASRAGPDPESRKAAAPVCRSARTDICSEERAALFAGFQSLVTGQAGGGSFAGSV